MALRKGGMIRSIKGPQGGYLLAKKPGEILLSEVIRLLDGDYLLEKEVLEDGDRAFFQKKEAWLLWKRILSLKCGIYIRHSQV